MRFGGKGEAPRRGEIQPRMLAPRLAHDPAQGRTSQRLLHDPEQFGRVGGADMDERKGAVPEAGGMDAPGLEDGHPFLYPQERTIRACLREQEPHPARIARMGREDLAERWLVGERDACPAEQVIGCTPALLAFPLGKVGWRPHEPPRGAVGQRHGKLAGADGKAICHTTRRHLVLVMFYFAQQAGRSQIWRKSRTGSKAFALPLQA